VTPRHGPRAAPLSLGCQSCKARHEHAHVAVNILPGKSFAYLSQTWAAQRIEVSKVLGSE
jgi:hypothetical protein